jgi:hypothetical protein
MQTDFASNRFRRRAALLVIASAALHGLAILVLPDRTLKLGAPDTQAQKLGAVAIELLELPAQRPAQPAAVTESPVVVVPERASHRIVTAPPAPALHDDVEAQPGAPASATPPPQAEPQAQAVAAAATLPDLSPRAAARSLLPPRDELAAPGRAEAEADHGAALAAGLAQAANAEARALREPRPVELRRDPDGSCHYSGNAIDATILPDGGVQFEEKLPVETRKGVEVPPERPATPEDLQAPQRLELAFKLRPGSAAGERQRFLRDTEALRAELGQAARASELRSAEFALRKQLDRIWCDAARSAADRRRAIFTLWDETSPDAEGARGRGVILDYVRRNLAEHAPDAYRPEELAELNLSRSHAERFDPYASEHAPDAGTQ